MKKTKEKALALVIFLCLLFSGCASTSFLGLAKTTYVDEKTQADKEEVQTELEQLRKEIDKITEVTGDLEELMNEISETKKATEQLQELAKEIEVRFQELPKETLTQLMEIIRKYLEEK